MRPDERAEVVVTVVVYPETRRCRRLQLADLGSLDSDQWLTFKASGTQFRLPWPENLAAPISTKRCGGGRSQWIVWYINYLVWFAKSFELRRRRPPSVIF